MKIRFHFEPLDYEIDRFEIIEWLYYDIPKSTDLFSLSDKELIEYLNKHSLSEFADFIIGHEPQCIKCEVADE